MHFLLIYVIIILTSTLLYYMIGEKSIDKKIRNEECRHGMSLKLAQNLDAYLLDTAPVRHFPKKEALVLYERMVISNFLTHNMHSDSIYMIGFIDQLMYRWTRKYGYDLEVDKEFYKLKLSLDKKRKILISILSTLASSTISFKTKIEISCSNEEINVLVLGGSKAYKNETFKIN